MSEKLLPCPFCGATPAVSDQEGSAIHISRRCGAQLWGNKRHFGTHEEATAAWNTRAQQPSAAQSGWISVEERLPPPFEDVLIYPRPTDYCCEGQVDHKGQWTYSEYDAWGDGKHRINPTHWAPHLAPPTLEQFKKESNG